MAIPRDALQCQIHDSHSPRARLHSLRAHQHLWGGIICLIFSSLPPYLPSEHTGTISHHLDSNQPCEAFKELVGVSIENDFCEYIWNLHITKHRLLSGFRKRGGFSHQFTKVILGQTIRNCPFISEKWSNTGNFRWFHLIHFVPLENVLVLLTYLTLWKKSSLYFFWEYFF